VFGACRRRIHPRDDRRAGRRAHGRAGPGVSVNHASAREFVHIRRGGERVPVTAHVRAVVFARNPENVRTGSQCFGRARGRERAKTGNYARRRKFTSPSQGCSDLVRQSKVHRFTNLRTRGDGWPCRDAVNVTAKDANHMKRNSRRPWSQDENPQKTTKETKMQAASSFSLFTSSLYLSPTFHSFAPRKRTLLPPS